MFISFVNLFAPVCKVSCQGVLRDLITKTVFIVWANCYNPLFGRIRSRGRFWPASRQLLKFPENN